MDSPRTMATVIKEAEMTPEQQSGNNAAGLTVKSPATNMIFSHVIASLALEFLEHMPGDKQVFLKSFMSPGLGLHHNRDTGALCVYGMLDDIVRCRDRLREFRDKQAGVEKEVTQGVVNVSEVVDSGKVCVDVGVTCDILTVGGDSRKTNVGCDSGTGNTKHLKAKTLKSYHSNNEQSKTESPCSKTLETVVEENEAIRVKAEEQRTQQVTRHMTFTKDGQDDDQEVRVVSKVPSLSRSGRKIKRPLKLEEADPDSIKLDEEEVTEPEVVVEPEIKHRRLIHSGAKKRLTGVKAKHRDRISVDEVRRLVQEEKEKEAREKAETEGNIEAANEANDEQEYALQYPDIQQNVGVLQNIFLNGLTELQVQEAQKDTIKLFSEMKASDNTKQMKKYYEDRMPFKYFCSYCSFKSKRESHYNAHKKLHEKNPYMEMHKCDQCDFMTIRQGTLRRHLLTHTENLLKCSACSYQTNSFKQLDNHKKKHLKKESSWSTMPKLKCNLCNFTSLSKVKLIAHMDLHRSTVDGEQVFRCSMCKYNSKRKEHLNRHLDNVHSNKRPFLCDLCGAAFKRVDALAAHKTTHLDRSKRKLPFLCPHCKKGFKSQAHLKEHMSVHTTVRSFQCHICGQMFKTRAVQRRHQQSIHFNPRSHKCATCNKDFNTKYAFQRHLRIHDNDPAGQVATQIQPQVAGAEDQSSPGAIVSAEVSESQAVVDESISAIQTITIAPENLTEFTQQLQSVSDQLQSATDIGEIYIQGLEGVEGETINIINLQGQDVRQIYVPESHPSHLTSVPSSADTIKQIFITAKSDDDPTGEQIDDTDKKAASLTQPEMVKQIFISTEAGTQLNVAGLKELLVQTEQGSEEMRHILVPSVEQDSGSGAEFQGASETLVMDVEDVRDQGLIVQGDGEKGETGAEGDTGAGTGAGPTYEIQLENGQTLLTLGAAAVQNL